MDGFNGYVIYELSVWLTLESGVVFFWEGGLREDEFRQKNLVTVWDTAPQGNGPGIESLRGTSLPSGHS